MRRRVLQRFSDSSPLLEVAMKGLMNANYELRSRTGLDLGMLFFLPVHEGFGGRIRYLISGGSALPPEVLKSFVGMGFDFFEGYGLTETSPVLTVTSPKKKALPGSVGQPLPGVEVKIHEPDASGVGEVIARGRNVMAGYWEDDVSTGAAIQDGWFHTGDLGRFDGDGNLYLVGRSKDVIVDSNGKNVYPDEIEELYAGCAFVKELSVVGVPEAGGEHVAGAVVPDYDKDPLLSRDAVHARIDEHFRKISSGLPFWRRIKTTYIWEGELPKTAKRSVKRREVVAQLVHRKSDAELALGAAGGGGRTRDRLGCSTSSRRSAVGRGARFTRAAGSTSWASTASCTPSWAWRSSRPRCRSPRRRTSRRRGRSRAAPHAARSGRCARGSGRRRRRGGGGAQGRAARGRGAAGLGAGGDVHVPRPLARLGKRALGLGQRWFYGKALDSEISGQDNIPLHTNFIVAANHCSHLDMGLVKVALGPAGEGITSLAAADYFFRDKYRRAYFKNFTNLVPMERAGSIRKSMDTAELVLRQGKSMVVFPEGTRSLTGALAEFLPSLGYLAVRSGVGILPAYVSGTYEALPKGTAIPRARTVGVAFGPFLSIDDLQRLTHGLSAQEGWRLIAAVTQRIVENLRDGVPNRIEPEEVRRRWDGHHLAPAEPRGARAPARSLRSVP